MPGVRLGRILTPMLDMEASDTLMEEGIEGATQEGSTVLPQSGQSLLLLWPGDSFWARSGG